MKHIMFDLETMGMAPDGAIASIGAIRFDPFGTELSDPFYVVVDIAGQEKEFRRTISGDTVLWWMQQEEAARNELFRGDRIPLPAALKQFADYVGASSVPTWAYPSTFDHVVLHSAYRAAGLKPPIHYRDELCMRGIAKMAKVECPHHPGVAHNALADAERQARWLQAILAAKWIK